MKFYLAYGSNLNMKKMKFRCPNSIPICNLDGMKIKVLKGWKLTFNRYANIIKDKNSYVPIGMYKITKDCEKKLDIYEDYPFLYKKIIININSISAMTYIMKNRGRLKPSKKYINEIMIGYENFDLDKKYLINLN